MGSFNGAARTNFFKVENLNGLRKALEPFDIKIVWHGSIEGFYYLHPDSEDHSWPSYATIENEDGEYEEIEFSFEEHVMPFAQEGAVVVAMSVGAEKLRYISGYAFAFIRKGEEVLRENISLSEIYERAAKKFEVDEGLISECRYSDLPKYLMDLERGRTRRLENMVEHGFRWQNEAALLWQMAARSGENEPLEYLVRLGADPLEHRAVFEMKGVQAASRAWLEQHVMQREIEQPVQTARSFLRRSN